MRKKTIIIRKEADNPIATNRYIFDHSLCHVIKILIWHLLHWYKSDNILVRRQHRGNNKIRYPVGLPCDVISRFPNELPILIGHLRFDVDQDQKFMFLEVLDFVAKVLIA